MYYCFPQHVSCFMCVSSLDLLVVISYAMFYVQIYLLTCLYVQIYMLSIVCHAFLCFVPLFCFVQMLGLCAHMLVMLCLDLCAYALSPCFMLISTSVHVHMLGSMSYHVYVLSFHMFTCMFPCLYDQIQVSTCLLALCHLPCACVLRAMFVCLDLGYVCHAMCYCSPFVALSFFSCVLAYWFVLNLDPMVFVIVHTPWPISKGLDHPIFMSMLAMLVCATRWLSVHFYMLAYMSMHQSCLLVCRPHFNTMKLWTFDPNLHLSFVDTTFCLLSCLFPCLFVGQLSCFCHMLRLLYLSCLFALHPFPIIYASLPFHCLSVGFLSLPLHVHTWSEDVWSQGMVSQAQAKRIRMRACRFESSRYSQQVQGLAFPFGYVLF